MCDCNSRCNMRSDRVIPPNGDPFGGGVPLYSAGFGSPTMGNVRGEPVTTLPPLRAQTVIANTPPPGAYTSPAGAALAASQSASPITDALKEHWMLLLAGGLVLAAVLWK